MHWFSNMFSGCQEKYDPERVVLETNDLPRTLIIIYNKHYYNRELNESFQATNWSEIAPAAELLIELKNLRVTCFVNTVRGG